MLLTSRRMGFLFSLLLALLWGNAIVGAQERIDWRIRWEKVVQAAKKEGQVQIYTTFPEVLDAGVFQGRYPDIRVVVVPGRGVQNQQRILSERRAGKYLADIFNAGITVFQGIPLEPVSPSLILPEVVDPSKWWQGKHRYGDPEGQFIFVYTGVPQVGSVSHNSQLVNPKEFKSFRNFLHPKWKGKIEARDVRVSGPGGGAMRFFYHHPELGPEFIRRLFGEMDVTLFRDLRQGTDWLAHGKYSLCFFCGDIEKSKRQGLPVDSFGLMKEGAGLAAQDGAVALVNKAPHPNAAVVFLNWFLSREGQLTLQKALAKAGESALDSLRTDISKDEVPLGNRRLEGFQYLDMDLPERRDMKPVLKVLEEALVGAGKK